MKGREWLNVEVDKIIDFFSFFVFTSEEEFWVVLGIKTQIFLWLLTFLVVAPDQS